MEDKSEVLSDRIAEIKLRRIQEFNSRLKEALLRERIPASNASLLYVFMLLFTNTEVKTNHQNN